jgi:hypothetical protein
LQPEAPCDRGASGVLLRGRCERDLKIAAELADKIHGDTGMDPALLVIKHRARSEREYGLVPD